MTTDYPPWRCGGYELQCAGSVEHLRRRRHRVRVLAGEQQPGASPPAEDGAADVHRDLPRFSVDVRQVPAQAAWAAERRAAAVLHRHLRGFGPDVVCLWRLGELSMSLPARLRRAGVPAVGMVCDPWMIDGPQRDPWSRLWARRPLAAALLELVTRVPARPRLGGAARWLFVSEALRDQVRAAGSTVDDGDVVPAGVDLDVFPLAPMKPWSGRLLCAGRLSRLKGVDTAVRALARLGPAVTLEIAGGGDRPYERSLRALAAALGVAHRVRFRGALSRPALSEAYAEADAVLFPVRWEEPFGLVPLEAMARGTPVVAAASGGAVTHLSDEHTALVVPPDDPAAVATAVERLRADEALRATLRAAGRRTAEAHPAERSHAVVSDALEEAAAGRRRRERDAARRRPERGATMGG